MPRVSQAHLDSRRAQILGAAIACFMREGFHRTTMQDIVRQSGLSAGAIYRYFASKAEIVGAIADERHARERRWLTAARARARTGSRLRELVDVFFGSLADPEERKRRRLGVQVWAEALRDPRVLRMVRRGVEEPMRVLAGLVAQAQRRGELPASPSPEAVARVMIALFQGFVLQQAWDERVDTRSYVQAIEALFDSRLVGPGRRRRLRPARAARACRAP